MVEYVNGMSLAPATRREALARYVHRYTRRHVPAWARGTNYKPQFADDADWLANTDFPVTKSGRLANHPEGCRSRPTWPEGKGVNGQKGVDY